MDFIASQPVKNWKSVQKLDDALQLIDLGIVLNWTDCKVVKKSFSDDDQAAIMKHFALRLAEHSHMRLSTEITIESLLVWLSLASNERLLEIFLKELFLQPEWKEAAWALVEISLTAEVAENENDDQIFAMAVALICELGVGLSELQKAYPNEFKGAELVLSHIDTYLLSVSNTNNSVIRFSLLHYFGYIERGERARNCFNKIMGRFGHTALDNLFALLFNKKSEAVALQYLQENLPFVLEGDRHCQKICHETFKFYMLKNPERFALFLQAFSDHLRSLDGADFNDAINNFVSHLTMLFGIAAEVNHKQLARELLFTLVKFEGSKIKEEFFETLAKNPDLIRRSMRDLIYQVATLDTKKAMDSLVQMKVAKRGRRPSFTKAEPTSTIHQVNYLAQHEQVVKAS